MVENQVCCIVGVCAVDISKKRICGNLESGRPGLYISDVEVIKEVS